MTKTAEKKIIKQIIGWATQQFGGSGDIEKEDAVHVCDYLTQTYGTNPNILKETLETFKRRLEMLDPAWALTRHPIATTVPAFTGCSESIRVSVSQLGFEEASSMKGKSKMLNVFECMQNFLEKPYNSLENPLFIQFGADAVVGERIGDFSVMHRIGFSKSLAAKTIILSAIECGLDDASILLLKDRFEALFIMSAVYEESDEKARFEALRKKFEESSRPRPDVIQVLYTFTAQAKADNQPLGAVMTQYIADFNGGSDVEMKQLSELEQSIVMILPELLPTTLDSIAYHWDNFKAKHSGLPLAHLGTKPFLSGTKPRAGEESNLWNQVLRPSPEARHAYVMRRIGIFNARVKEASRLGKKVNLSFQSDLFRDKYAPEDNINININIRNPGRWRPCFRISYRNLRRSCRQARRRNSYLNFAAARWTRSCWRKRGRSLPI